MVFRSLDGSAFVGIRIEVILEKQAVAVVKTVAPLDFQNCISFSVNKSWKSSSESLWASLVFFYGYTWTLSNCCFLMFEFCASVFLYMETMKIMNRLYVNLESFGFHVNNYITLQNLFCFILLCLSTFFLDFCPGWYITAVY